MRRRLIPDIATFQAFESAARHRSFTRAAVELNLTQSAISRQIRDLEEQTGLRLFERVRQRVVLSEAGSRLLPDVRRLLAQTEQLMIGAVAAGHMKMSLNVATLPTFGARWLMPRLGDFIQRWPEIAITIESRSRPFDFEAENFDLAIHYGQPSWAHAACTFLCNETVVPVASRRTLERGQFQRPDDLLHAPLLHLTTRPRLWARWFEHAGVSTDDAYRGVRLDQFSMIIAAAASDIGVALVPSYLIEDELKSGILQPVFDLPLSTENSYYIAVPESKVQNAAAGHFLKWITEQVSDKPSADVSAS